MNVKEKERKRLRKQRKKRIYELKEIVSFRIHNEINKSIDHYASIKVKEELRFISWLVKRDLERKGYECELEEWFDGNDLLSVRW